jgi:hypothetical protein
MDMLVSIGLKSREGPLFGLMFSNPSSLSVPVFRVPQYAVLPGHRRNGWREPQWCGYISLNWHLKKIMGIQGKLSFMDLDKR